MQFYPFFHKLSDKRCLVVGGGVLALRRAQSLLSAGAVVDVISPDISAELLAAVQESGGVYIDAEFDSSHVEQAYFCMVSASNNRAVNQAVTDYAKAQAVLVNVVDAPEQCDFVFPALIDRSPLTIAISSGGASPVLAKLLKQQLEVFVPRAYGALSQLLSKYRQRVKEKLPNMSERAHFWEDVLQGAVAESVFSGKPQEAEALLEKALSDPQAFAQQGEVYLIGAGPGDPDLLTLRAFRLLQQADVVLYDRLVSQGVMDLIPSSTELVYVGKKRDKHSVPQGGINALLVEHAKQGKRVARLKGGDPFIFGRGGEEIETLADENIPFQVVPGITAANGCSTYAGIPLTHRDYAQSVQFVTGQLKNGTIDLNWQELIAPGKTLVFYMGLKSLPVICQSLIDNGMKKIMPVALIEKGTTQSQRILISTLKDLAQDISGLSISSPSLFIVGEVVQLSKKLNWFEENKH